MIESFVEESKEEPLILESEMIRVPKAVGGKISPGVDGMLIELFQSSESEVTESVKILTQGIAIKTFTLHGERNA